MAIIEDGKTCVIVGITVNALFLVLKFVVFIYSHLNLFFTDCIDSFADAFIILLLLIALRFNLSNKVTFLNMDIMFFCQWSAVLIFRVIIFLEQIADLIRPEPRSSPELVIVISVVVIVGGLFLAIIFVDEDDVIKCFISDEEKRKRKLLRAQQAQAKAQNVADKPPASAARNPSQSSSSGFTILPIFAEAMDNLVTSVVALIVGCLLYAGVAVDYLYLIDDISNMVISLVMSYLAIKGITELTEKYRDKSYFECIFTIQERALSESSQTQSLLSSGLGDVELALSKSETASAAELDIPHKVQPVPTAEPEELQ
jgi:Co/Zn/Cd efflux system component